MNGTYENIDCMELMATLKDKEIDLAIVDPEYGVNKQLLRTPSISKGSKFSNKYFEKQWDKGRPPIEYFKELFRVSKNQIIWGGNYFADLLRPARCYIVWDKLCDGFTSINPEMAWTNFDLPIGIFKRGHGLDKGFMLKDVSIHPTQKPVKLYEWLLTNYAKPNDLILDTHCGSASSLIACENLGFKYIASELDKDYYSQSLQRLEAHLAQGKLFQRVGRDEIRLEQPSMFA